MVSIISKIKKFLNLSYNPMIEKTKFNPSYISPRKDVISLIPKNCKKILDVGCAIGSLGEYLKKQNSGIEVYGIELNEKMAEVAKTKLDGVIVGNIEYINLDKYFNKNYFDCIVLADVLEHLINPWDVLKNIKKFLKDDGVIIISIPNVRHYTTILNLLMGYWPYRNRGIHDKTHLRFFTLNSVLELLHYAELSPIIIKRKYRIIEYPHPLNILAKYFAIPYITREFLTYQYLIVCKKR